MSIPRNDSERRFSVRYGARKFDCLRIDSVSRRPRITIKVHPDTSVRVHAPAEATEAEVVRAAEKRGHWISKQVAYFSEQLEGRQERRYVSGESHFYLGRRYLLKVEIESKSKPQVKLLRGKLALTTPRRDCELARKTLEDWYRNRAADVFRKRLSEALKQTLWVEHSPALRIRRMSKQWGNCSPSGTLTLNYHLVKAPRECIDYVLLHELAHHAEHNHSKRFYRLLDRVMPAWRKAKARLEALGPQILA